MAQYFYDFKDLQPGTGLPNGSVRLFDSLTSDFYQEFFKTKDGCIQWFKNSDAGTGNYSSSNFFGPDVSAANVECLVKLVNMRYNGGGFANDGPAIFCRVNSRSNYQNGYEIALSGTPTATTTLARKRVAVVSTTLSGSSGGISRAAPVWIRFKIAGSTIQIKTWADGASEPGSWGQTWTDSDITAAGFFGFGFQGASGTGSGPNAGTQYLIFQLSFGTDGDAAPATFTRAVSGTVLDPIGDAAEGYIVRCYSRVTGAMLAETLSIKGGSFSFSLGTTEKVYC